MLISSVDYNLLRPLLALLEERSVTRAAARLGVAQPTMSIALRRLRAHFGDPLLERKSNVSELTPLATHLLEVLPELMREVERVFHLQAGFVPATSTRVFSVAGVDHMIERVGPPLSRAIAAEAPSIRLEFPAADARLVNNAPASLRSVDGAILPHGYLAQQPHLDLWTESWMCVVDASSGLDAGSAWEELLARPWVHTLGPKDGMSLARQQLRVRGIDVRVAVVAPFFKVVPSFVRGTNRVALLPASLAAGLAGVNDLLAFAPPVALDPIRDAFWWHPDRDDDAGHRWFRSVLSEVANDIADRNQ
ncbi:LysR family transcriptional regulator [Microbacterium foliorum]|uniref:LysR family transcriptional regulator n=1 Tax=Microbacterium foliorum TaxID=104336 RepID=UPI003736F413